MWLRLESVPKAASIMRSSYSITLKNNENFEDRKEDNEEKKE